MLIILILIYYYYYLYNVLDDSEFSSIPNIFGAYD